MTPWKRVQAAWNLISSKSRFTDYFQNFDRSSFVEQYLASTQFSHFERGELFASTRCPCHCQAYRAYVRVEETCRGLVLKLKVLTPSGEIV